MAVQIALTLKGTYQSHSLRFPALQASRSALIENLRNQNLKCYLKGLLLLQIKRLHRLLQWVFRVADSVRLQGIARFPID